MRGSLDVEIPQVWGSSCCSHRRPPVPICLAPPLDGPLPIVRLLRERSLSFSPFQVVGSSGPASSARQFLKSVVRGLLNKVKAGLRKRLENLDRGGVAKMPERSSDPHQEAWMLLAALDHFDQRFDSAGIAGLAESFGSRRSDTDALVRLEYLYETLYLNRFVLIARGQLADSKFFSYS